MAHRHVLQLTGYGNGPQACVAADRLVHAVIMKSNALVYICESHVVNQAIKTPHSSSHCQKQQHVSDWTIQDLSMIVIHSGHCRCVSMSMIPSTSRSLKLQAKA